MVTGKLLAKADKESLACITFMDNKSIRENRRKINRKSWRTSSEAETSEGYQRRNILHTGC